VIGISTVPVVVNVDGQDKGTLAVHGDGHLISFAAALGESPISPWSASLVPPWLALLIPICHVGDYFVRRKSLAVLLTLSCLWVVVKERARRTALYSSSIQGVGKMMKKRRGEHQGSIIFRSHPQTLPRPHANYASGETVCRAGQGSSRACRVKRSRRGSRQGIKS
jgi:hypothetical protein